MIISSQQFNEAYKKLPYVLREYFANDELAAITEEMGHEYHLHIDTTGALYRETTNMLLGLINPEQFVAELKSVGIPQENISSIVTELNTKIFIPLRGKMQHPPEELESSDDEEGEVPQEAGAPTIETQTVALGPIPGAPPIPAVQWVQVTPVSTTPNPATPVTPAPPTPIEHTPVTLSAVQSPIIRPIESPTIQQAPTPKIQPQKTENRDALHAVLKEYGIDPYRESPE